MLILNSIVCRRQYSLRNAQWREDRKAKLEQAGTNGDPEPLLPWFIRQPLIHLAKIPLVGIDTTFFRMCPYHIETFFHLIWNIITYPIQVVIRSVGWTYTWFIRVPLQINEKYPEKLKTKVAGFNIWNLFVTHLPFYWIFPKFKGMFSMMKQQPKYLGVKVTWRNWFQRETLLLLITRKM